MNPLEIAKLILTLGPALQSVVVEGGKILATFRSDMAAQDMIKALADSKSAHWPDLTFGVQS